MPDQWSPRLGKSAKNAHTDEAGAAIRRRIVSRRSAMLIPPNPTHAALPLTRAGTRAPDGQYFSRAGAAIASYACASASGRVDRGAPSRLPRSTRHRAGRPRKARSREIRTRVQNDAGQRRAKVEPLKALRSGGVVSGCQDRPTKTATRPVRPGEHGTYVGGLSRPVEQPTVIVLRIRPGEEAPPASPSTPDHDLAVDLVHEVGAVSDERRATRAM